MSCGICGGFFCFLLLFLCLFQKFLCLCVVWICFQQFVQALDCLVIVSFVNILSCLIQFVLTSFFGGLLFCLFFSSFFGGSFLGGFLFGGSLFSSFLFGFFLGSFFGGGGFCGSFLFGGGFFSSFFLCLVFFVQFLLGFIQEFFGFRIIWICFQKSIERGDCLRVFSSVYKISGLGKFILTCFLGSCGFCFRFFALGLFEHLFCFGIVRVCLQKSVQNGNGVCVFSAVYQTSCLIKFVLSCFGGCLRICFRFFALGFFKHLFCFGIVRVGLQKSVQNGDCVCVFSAVYQTSRLIKFVLSCFGGCLRICFRFFALGLFEHLFCFGIVRVGLQKSVQNGDCVCVFSIINIITSLF